MKKDITGQRFDRLVVLSNLKKSGQIYWHCKCDCGNECDVNGVELRRGNIGSCGCLAIDTLISKRSSTAEGAFTEIYDIYKNQAKNRRLDFSLTKEQFKSLLKRDCYYCGNKPLNTFNSHTTKGLHSNFTYNEIGLIDSDNGYTIANCIPCCGICSFFKDDLTIEQFRDWLKQAYRYQFKKVTDKTPGELVDSLITIDIKCFMAQEDLCKETDSMKVAEAAKKAQELNAKRNRVMRSIDALLDFGEDMATEKTYDK